MVICNGYIIVAQKHGRPLYAYNPSNAAHGYFRPKYKDTKIFENHLNLYAAGS